MIASSHFGIVRTINLYARAGNSRQYVRLEDDSVQIAAYKTVQPSLKITGRSWWGDLTLYSFRAKL